MDDKKKKKPSLFEVLVFVAYGFYLLLGLVWTVMSFIRQSSVNYFFLGMTIFFGAQVFARHKLANLIAGIVILFFSIPWFLDELVASSKSPVRLSISNIIFTTLPALSLILSGVLVFSYIKLSFQDQE